MTEPSNPDSPQSPEAAAPPSQEQASPKSQEATLPEPVQQPPSQSQRQIPPQARQDTGPRWELTYRDVIMWAFGILLPVAALGVELAFSFCGDVFFDPTPTVWHAALIAFVPASNFLMWLARVRGTTHPRLLALANGAAMGIALIYTFVMLPILPVSIIAVLVLGIGVLAWAPAAALFAGIMARIWLWQPGTEAFKQSRLPVVAGFCLGILALTGIEMPSTLTRIGMQMADDPATEAKGVQWLRTFGDRDVMLRMCYERTGRATDVVGSIMSMGNNISPDEARKLFYRVTGQPFNSMPIPFTLRSLTQGARRWSADVFDFDFDQAGDAVGGVARGLYMSGSRLDGSVDPQAALAYLEWTMQFKNTSPINREARAQIALPPGAVVSRVTLWVNGQEREAAFAGRHETRQAYQSVVRQQRDPILVTTAGPDRVLMQCFPVPSDDKGEMKVRLGITVPLILRDRGTASLTLPSFLERNFEARAAHNVCVESRQPIEPDGVPLQVEHPREALFAVRGELANTGLSLGKSILARRDPRTLNAWSVDPLNKGKLIIRQTIKEGKASAPKRLFVVVDGSIGMNQTAAQVAAALAKAPPSVQPAVLLAADDIELLYSNPSTSTTSGSAAALRKHTYVGGQDNLPAVVKAWELAARTPGAAVLWIHAPQPVTFGSPDELKERLTRRPDGPLLYELQVSNGPDRIVEGLDGAMALHTVPRTGTVEQDLSRLLALWSGQAEEFIPVRARLAAQETDEPGVETSAHLARLWAHDETLAELSRNEPESAVKLASIYQLITPVTGAVVLETMEQYKRAGLEPVDPSTVPSVPEPEFWLLAFAAGAFVIIFSRRKPGSSAA